MRHLNTGRQSLTAIVALNIDRVLVTGAIAGTMLLAAFVQSL